MYIKHVFTAALTRWLHSVLVLVPALAWPGYLISSELSITTNPNMSRAGHGTGEIMHAQLDRWEVEIGDQK